MSRPVSRDGLRDRIAHLSNAERKILGRVAAVRKLGKSDIFKAPTCPKCGELMTLSPSGRLSHALCRGLLSMQTSTIERRTA